MMRHIWSLFAKAGSLWVAWVKENLLKGKSFWQVSILQICTWSWRKLLMLRDEAKHFISFNVGDGKNIYLWFDAWHPDGMLYEKYGHRVIYDVHIKLKARLDPIIQNGQWYWLAACSDHLSNIQSRLCMIPIGDEDKPKWNASKTGTFSCSDTWGSIQVKEHVVDW